MMEEDRKQKVVDKLQAELDAEGLDAQAARVSPEIAMLVQLYARAPTEEMRYWIGSGVGGKLPQIMATAATLCEYGPAITVEDAAANSIQVVFAEAISDLEGDLGDLGITASIRKAGEDIAEILDKALSTVIITARNDKHFNREAYLDLLAAHSAMVAALVGLDTVPECYSDDESDGQPTTTH